MRTKIADSKQAKALAGDNIPRKALAGFIQSIGKSMTRERMAKIVKDAASQVSRMMTGYLADFSADRMVAWLTRLGFDVTITVTPTTGRIGKVKVVYGGEG